jgi:hypothetical protein
MLVAERTRARPRLDREVAPAGLLIGGALAVALVAALTGLQVTIAALDESVYKFAAVQHANDFPFGPFNESTSRGAARLYSYVVSPIFALFDGDVAVRLARALNGVFFAATALPVALLARRVTTSPWSGAAAGLLAVAVPWLTLATIMFSESLAYLLFACTVLAMLRALERPSAGRDAVVIALLVALILTRVQFVVLAPAWVIVIAVVERRRTEGWRGLGADARRRFPVTVACVALAVAGALGLLLVGVLTGGLREVAGPYYEIGRRDTVPGNFGLGLLWEVEMLAIGVGLLPAALAAAWFARALGRREEPDAFRFAALALTLVGVLFAGTLWAQGGFLDFRSEERYFIYAVPLLWIGAVAAIERRDLPARWIATAGVALAFVLFTVPISVQNTGEQVFLGPVSLSAAHVLPRLERTLNDAAGLGGLLSGRDIAGLVCLLLVAGGAFAWRRGPRARMLALVPAVALQLFVAAYAFSGVYGKLEGVGGLTPDVAFSDHGWVDRTTPGNPRVPLLDNQSEGREGGQRNTVFWNDEVASLYKLEPLGLAVPGFPVFTLPTTSTGIAPDLNLTVPLPDLAVSAVDSPLWQVEGETVRTSPDGSLALVRPAKPGRASWVAEGIDTDGQVPRAVTMRARRGNRVVVDVATPIRDEQSSVARFRFAGRDETLRFGPGQPEQRTLTFDLCGGDGIASGTIEPSGGAHVGDNRFSGARLLRVRLEPC